ncbi:SH3 domain-containing protein [Thalassotalea sp. ND16A]|uniref:SH3 domain-containing protein n=1 Tax=Thalassotalea sp. ND16A TaxID=1535422 RepID=UPI00051A5B6A|nr:SH3 domain-containing protein [Thalassotalea sp. ND16A]KGJ97146.1 hypothetical protein ND16A_0068 [Thalassotalea sp. ND16A]
MHLLLQFFKSSLLTAICLLSMAFSVSAESNPKVQVATAFINMHTGPSAEQPIFYVAEQGEWITVESRRTGYFKIISSDGTAGWISFADMANTLDVDGNKVVITPAGLAGILAKFG